MLLFTPPLMRKVCANMVPRLLNDDQKECCMQLYQDIIERLQTEPDLLRNPDLLLSTIWKLSARAVSGSL